MPQTSQKEVTVSLRGKFAFQIAGIENRLAGLMWPTFADIKHEICQAYNVEAESGEAYRGSFLIDRAGIVRHQVVNDMPLGRDIDEMLRMVDALQFHEEHGEVCPAGWRKGKAGMQENAAGAAKYLAEHAKTL